MSDNALYIVFVFLLTFMLAAFISTTLEAKARTDALKVCAAHNISLSECDAYWERAD